MKTCEFNCKVRTNHYAPVGVPSTFAYRLCGKEDAQPVMYRDLGTEDRSFVAVRNLCAWHTKLHQFLHASLDAGELLYNAGVPIDVAAQHVIDNYKLNELSTYK